MILCFVNIRSVLRDRLVRRAISLIGNFPRKCMRWILAYMLMVITSSSLLVKNSAGSKDTLVNFGRKYTALAGQFWARTNT